MSKRNSKIIKFSFLTGLIVTVISIFITSDAKSVEVIPGFLSFEPVSPVTPPQDTSDIPFPVKDKKISAADPEESSPLFLDKPGNIQTVIEYDPESQQYIIREQVGGRDYKMPSTMTFEEYSNYQLNKAKSQYWRSKKMGTEKTEQSFIPSINIRSEAFDKIFGSNTIDIVPQGSAELIFGYQMNKIDNPTFTEKMRKTPSFNFEEKIQMNVSGSIGEKVELGINYNTEATFEFENQTNLGYEGDEDEIIKKIEAGNLSFSLPGSLIPGSQNLFGVRTDLQFGKLHVSTVFSQQKSESSNMQVEGGAQISEFEVNITDYDANRHFFLSHYFKERYDSALSELPVIRSNIEIREVEVWVTNRNDYFENARDIIAFSDLAVPERSFAENPKIVAPFNNGFPQNNSNILYNQLDTLTDFSKAEQTISQSFGDQFRLGVDYEKIEKARKLDSRDYTINKELGYISLNSSLNNDEILGVAYTYKVIGRDSTYKVGELSREKPAQKALVVKLLKGTNLSPRFKTWELMMKNIYSIGAYQVQKEDFRLNIMYRDDKKGRPIAFLTEPETRDSLLIQALGMDKVNYRNEAFSDGVFDYLPGITILPQNGRIIFTTLRPFDTQLRRFFEDAVGGSEESDKRVEQLYDAYAFPELYEQTKTNAEQLAEKNKFLLSGKYKSSSGSEIQLNAMNVPQGSVRVTAGGIELAEGTDYTVDYTLGRVKILNQSILEAGTPINISLENNALFNFQTKTLFGTHMDYAFSDDFILGATFMHLNERPLTSKVNMGDEPISNTIWGLNGNYRSEAPWLTKMVDKIPLIETKEKSNITVDAEFAHLIPGAAKAISNEEGAGRAYIDDFEGSETSYDLTHPYAWYLSSTPNTRLFPEADSLNKLIYNFNRARLAYYIVDPLFNTTSSSLKPDHIGKDQQSNHFVREIYEQEIWPNRDRENNIPTRVSPMNVAFYPNERGPYNFDTSGVGNISAGLTTTGELNQPETRWGGIMRGITSSDFEQQNVEFIEIWVMDPYAEDTSIYNSGANKNLYGDSPSLYLNLGDISEDILKDGLKSFEHGLPARESDNVPLDSSVWGYVSERPAWTDGFDTDETTRANQDVGLDGLIDEDERDTYSSYVNWVNNYVQNPYSDEFLDSVDLDPAADNFHYFRGEDYDQDQTSILDRYKYYNGLEQNNRTSTQSPEEYTTTGRTIPDQEDINDDNTLSYTERFFEYKISMHPEDLTTIGENYISDIVSHSGEYANGDPYNVRWLQFKIPLDDYEEAIGRIEDFKSIRFMRLYMHGFRKPVIMRFATIDLVRSNWRRYDRPLFDIAEDFGGDYESGKLSVTAINVEENGDRYALPPGFDREIDPSNPQLRQLNEQSMVLNVTDLADGDARAAYKNADLDLRQYSSLLLEVHGESLEDYPEIADGDLTVFLRLGSDYVDNYYEYEIPLKVTERDSIFGNINSGRNKRLIWPERNRMDIDLRALIDAKKSRNSLMNEPNSPIDYFTLFEVADGDNKIYVRGNPNLSNVRTIMIGVRNATRGNALKRENDREYKSAEIWVNELRLEDFRDKSGWAANARAKANLADFGNISLATAYSTPGFGTIEQKVNERAQETAMRVDAAVNLELGKFFPEDAGVSIPVYANYSKSQITPEYDPEDPDILLKEKLDNLPEKEAEEKAKRVLDVTERKSIAVTNLRVNKKGKKPQFYDPANVSVSYSYSEEKHSDIEIETAKEVNYKASLNYIYSSRAQNVRPFNKVQFLNSKYLRLIKDFNFYYMPSKVSFRTDLNRLYEETSIRTGFFLDGEEKTIDTYFKDFTWGRNYDLKWDLSRSLTFDFNASHLGRFDEDPKSDIDDFGFLGLTNANTPDDIKKNGAEGYKSIFGDRSLNYKHSFNVGYRVPINKIPLLDWMTINAKYRGQYQWNSGPVIPDEDYPVYNTISNSYNFSVNNSNRLTKLYHKVPLLKNIDQKYSGRGRRSEKKEFKTVTYVRERTNLREGAAKSINHKLRTEEVTVKVYDSDGNEVDGEVSIVNENKIRFAADEETRGAKVVVEGQVEKRDNPIIWVGEQTARILMGVKDLTVSYSQSEGSIIPGYKEYVNFFGMNEGFNDPSFRYIAGLPDRNLASSLYHPDSDRSKIAVHNYSPSLTRTFSQKYDANSTFEPFKGFRVRFTLNNSTTKSYIQNVFIDLENFSNDPFADRFESLSIGNYSMSYITFNTAFEELSSEDSYESAAFNKMSEYLPEVSRTLGRRNDHYYNNQDAINDGIRREYIDEENGAVDENYRGGFGPTSQKVLIPSFIAAYTGVPVNNVDINRNRPQFPLPNWNFTFNSLSNIPFVKKYVKSININHAYRSKYNVSSVVENEIFSTYPGSDVPYVDLQGNFMSQYDIRSISIDEQFAPLAGLDIQWHNSLITNIEYKQTRRLRLNFANTQVLEDINKELVVGLGYNIKEFTFQLDAGNGPKTYTSDLILRGDVSYRNNKSIIRSILLEADNEYANISGGENRLSIKFTADYAMTENFNVSLFYNRDANKPAVSTSYPYANTHIGFSIRFTLVQ